MSELIQDDQIDGPYWLKVSTIAATINPFIVPVWNKIINPADVQRALDENRFETLPAHAKLTDIKYNRADYDDAARIAYFVNTSQSTWDAIDVEVMHDQIYVFDGNHRLGAAIFKQATYILSNYGGYADDPPDEIMEKL